MTIGFGQNCDVARSSHGYTYAVCSVRADNVPSGQTVSISYRSSLHTFKPRTNVKWGSTTGTISLANDSVSGEPSNVISQRQARLQGQDRRAGPQGAHHRRHGQHRRRDHPADRGGLTGMRSPIVSMVAVDPFGDRLHPGPGAAFVVLAAFLISFLAIRTSARLTRSVRWWPGGIETRGVHVHHLVWGIGLMLLSGFLAFSAPLQAPWWHLVAIGFGVGAGFTLDEFALWVHLDDVYWAERGRSSFDAVICSLAFAALVVLGTRPFGLDEQLSIWGTIAVVGGVVGLAAVAFAKGRVLLGVIGLFVPIAALIGAVRLARPASPWARWRYDATKRRARRGALRRRPPGRAPAPPASATWSPGGPPRCGHERARNTPERARAAAREARRAARARDRAVPRHVRARSHRGRPARALRRPRRPTPRPATACASPAG